MRHIVFITILLLITLSAHAQKQVHVDLEKGESAWVLTAHDAGLMLRASNSLLYYSTAGELLWKRDLTRKDDYTGQGVRTSILITPSLSYVYHISFKGSEAVPFKVAQIAKEGTLKNFEFLRTTSSHRSLLSFFCDDQYLYILATGEGHELDDAKRGQEKLILNRYSHENQDHQVYEIDADPLPDDNNTVFWQYAGQVDGLHYLISKSLVPNEPKTIAALTGFNPEGEVKIKKTITETLINKWQRPVKMYDDDMSYSNLQNFDFYETGGSTLSEAQTAGGFMGFKVDPLHKCFYVYGLLGAKPFKRIAAEYDGFYINKYDLNGNPVWRMERTGDEELGGERIFHRGAAPAHRSIVLKSLPDGRLNVNIAWMKTEVEHDISATGEVLGLRSRENVWVHTQSSFDGTGQSAAAKFVKSQTDAGKNINYGIFATSKSDIVIRMNEKDPDLELYFFNK